MLISLICVYTDQDQYSELVNSATSAQHQIELIPLDNQSGRWSSAASAYNYGCSVASGEVFFFAHQDIRFIDDSFITDAVDWINRNPRDIVGVAGAISKDEPFLSRDMISGMYQGSLLMRHHTAQGITYVNTLDECLFAFNRNLLNEISFDEAVCDNWHFYAVDLCLQASLRGIKSVVLPAEVIHLSGGTRSDGYYLAQEKIKNKYKSLMPSFATTCGWTKTAVIDPYRPIVNDELAALERNGIPYSIDFCNSFETACDPGNLLFMPCFQYIRHAESMSEVDGSHFYSALIDSEASSCYDSIAMINNFIAGKRWLFHDLLDLKSGYVDSVEKEMSGSVRYRIGHIFFPFSNPKIANDAPSSSSNNADFSLKTSSLDEIAVERLEEAFSLGLEVFSNYLKSVGSYLVSCLQASGIDSDDGFEHALQRLCFDNDDAIKSLFILKDENDSIDRRAIATRVAYEKTLAFRLGGFASSIVHSFAR